MYEVKMFTHHHNRDQPTIVLCYVLLYPWKSKTMPYSTKDDWKRYVIKLELECIMGTIFESVVGLGLGNDYVMYVLQCVCYQNNQSFRLLSCAGELYRGKFWCQHPMSYVFVECCTYDCSQLSSWYRNVWWHCHCAFAQHTTPGTFPLLFLQI